MKQGKFEFTKGTYIIVIHAISYNEALAAWEALQERNYYPTGGKWYCSTNSCNPYNDESVRRNNISYSLYLINNLKQNGK